MVDQLNDPNPFNHIDPPQAQTGDPNPFNHIDPPAAKSFTQNVSDDISSRVDAVKNAKDLPNFMISSARLGVGGAADIGNDALKSLPGSSYVSDAARSIGQGIANLPTNSPGTTFGDVGKSFTGMIDKAAQAYPTVANAAGYVGDVGKLAGLAGAASVARSGVNALSDAAVNSPKLMTSLTPDIDPSILPSVKLATEKYGIPVALNQAAKSPTMNNIQKISQELPGSGQSAFNDQQMSKWNENVLKQIGGTGDSLTPDAVAQARQNVGQKFNDFGVGKTFDMGGSSAFQQQVSDILDNSQVTSSADARNNFMAQVGKIQQNIAADGTITGEKLNSLRSQINTNARTAFNNGNADTGNLLKQLEGSVIDTLAPDADAKSAMGLAKYQYKNLLAIEPLVVKAVGGNINPSALSGRLASVYGDAGYLRGNAGDMGELAQIGRDVLPSVKGSDTYQKALTGGTLGTIGAATAINPVLGAGVALKAGAVAGVNRLYQSGINRSQALMESKIAQATKKGLNP